ncbi:MAG: hypothetical protein R3C49_17060 [Planctomycetaceae bacterium]
MNSLLAVFTFELRRLLTPGRAFWWVLVAMFPPAIVLLMQNYGTVADVEQWQRILRDVHGRSFSPEEAQQQIDTVLTIAIYFLAPSIACMLGSLLTAAPSVASELEQHSWIYFATRPNGLFHLVVGKFLVATFWAGSAALLGTTAAMAVAKISGWKEAFLALTMVTCLSSAAYSALYMMVGTLFHRRAMVFCVAYTAGVELFLGFFPAIINRLTIQYRLRSLLFMWTTQSDEFRDSRIIEFVASTESTLIQLLWLASLTSLFMAISLVTVHIREFTLAAESDL